MSTRPETGPMQFGDDWPGIFIRGDNAAAYVFDLEAALRGPVSPMHAAGLRSLARMLGGAVEPNEVQSLPPWAVVCATPTDVAAVAAWVLGSQAFGGELAQALQMAPGTPWDDLIAEVVALRTAARPDAPPTREVKPPTSAAAVGCRASRGDGECFWEACPQIADGEPEKSGRSCPLWFDAKEE